MWLSGMHGGGGDWELAVGACIVYILICLSYGIYSPPFCGISVPTESALQSIF